MAKTRAKTILAIVTLAVFGSACGAILGIEDGILDPLDSGTDAREDSDIDGGTDSAADTNIVADAQEEDAGPPCVPDASDSVDDVNGIFVAPAPYGTSGVNCGSRVVPCLSLQAGIDRAQTLTRTKVFIARGTYAEEIQLHPAMTLIGGWDPLDTTWFRSCKSPPHDVVVIQSTSNVSVTADALGGTAGLETLTVKSKATAAPGETLYGVFARGTTTHLTLFDVIVSMSAGGDGALGDGGPQGAAAVTTDCPPSTGAQGDAGPSGLGADSGSFGDAGYVAAIGTPGSAGFTGHGGTGAAAPACTQCGACQGIALCTFNPGGQSCGTDGGAGCGGGPGTGGTPGAGGGSSIALFAWDAIVTVTASSLTAGPGGAGGRGGLGGDGGLGSLGTVGGPGPSCIVTCNGVCATTSSQGVAGAAGGRGGPGGPGGAGGGGAGGDSFAIVQAGGAVVTAPDAGLAFGAAGTSLGNGAPGTARARFP